MSENTYIRVRWLHDFEDEPVDLWSELNGERFETRKLEIFRDGSVGFASAAEATERTGLGENAVPPLDEIAQDPQFEAEEVRRRSSSSVGMSGTLVRSCQKIDREELPCVHWPQAKTADLSARRFILIDCRVKPGNDGSCSD